MKGKINAVLLEMARLIEAHRQELIDINATDIQDCDPSDRALYDRLKIDDAKVDNMIEVLQQLEERPSPLGVELYSFTHDNGIQITNRTVPFGTILIIYESRPDVTVEATATALKSGNKILLKGGKEARRSNLCLHGLWLKALASVGLTDEWIRYLDIDRTAMQAYLKAPDTEIDLIIPRGGERLIQYVHSVATCPVLVSGRGNNFLYVSDHAAHDMAINLIIQSKIQKISACNALDKVLIHKDVPVAFEKKVIAELQDQGVHIVTAPDEDTWRQEFLDMKMVVTRVQDADEAVDLINRYSGKHSATIVSDDLAEVDDFLDRVDCAAVYHNASTRFTDGFQFGLGAEMAISTQKLHHRGPLGIEHLVTNKWIIKGNGQTR